MNIDRRTVLQGMVAWPLVGPLGAVAQSGTTLQQVKDRKVLRVGAAPGDPWFYKDPITEKWSGVGVMLGEQMAKDLGVQFALVETTWANAPAAIQANQLDVQFVLDATEARRKAIDFPEQPLFYYAMGALLRPGLAAKSWADLDKPDIKVGVTLGTSVDTTLTGLLKNAKIERFASNDESVAAFVARRVDVVSQFHPALLVQQSRVKLGSVIIPSPSNPVPTSVGLRRDADPAFRNWVGERIADYYKSGRTQALFESYMKSKGLEADKIPGLVKEKW